MDWDDFGSEWGSWYSRLIRDPGVLRNSEGVPDTWRRLVAEPSAESVRRVWVGAEAVLPRLVHHLERAILGAAVAESDLGWLLVYHLKDWKEVGVEGLEDGFMFGGLAIEPGLLEEFEEQVGALPASIRALWLTHGFVSKSGSFIASLDPRQQRLARAPAVHPGKTIQEDPPRTADCLAISAVGSSLMTCLSREPGERAWCDHIVEAERWGPSFSPALRERLDDLLADWTFHEWEV